jgi:hypothetical protein
MKIYNYHPDHKTYLGSSDADPSPLEPGVFLIPAHATEIEPPQCSDCEIPVFNGTSWDTVENCCGTYYSIPSGQEIQHNNPLEPPENTTKEQPPEVPEGYILEWNNQWELKEIPSPPVLTPEEKLQASGLTVEELKELLGL